MKKWRGGHGPALLLLFLLLAGCDSPVETGAPAAGPATAQPQQESVTGGDDSVPVPENPQFELNNTRYLFDVTNHSVADLEALLQRAEEITATGDTALDELKIVLVLHGPDIHIFTQQNYDRNRRLVDLAARLDDINIIDMKICETTMSSMGISRSDIPDFIESVPFAPTAMRSYRDEGYIDL